MALEILPLTGEALARALPQVAALRIKVFREWPYLYDGDLTYEEKYLAPYLTTDQAVVVGAFEGTRLVGAATGMPLQSHDDAFAAAFSGSDVDPATLYYCAESVLLPSFRGQGAGHAFFDHREAVASKHGFKHATFCAVVRPQDHPGRPAHYRPLDAFWRARGYHPLPGVTARFAWRDVGETRSSEKQMQFWMRTL